MFTIITVMFLGVGIGYLFRRVKFLQKTEESISLTILLLLFILGVSVGSNELILNNLASFSGQAAVLASSAIFGSILASWLILNLFFKKEEKK